LDVAVLRIRNVQGLNNIVFFDYANRDQLYRAQAKDEVKAIGYPEGTRGVVTKTGTIEALAPAEGKTWFRAKAASTFGSAGAALVDRNGMLIGFTSESDEQRKPSEGYVLGMEAVTPWLEKALQRSAVLSPIQGDMDALIREQDRLQRANAFNRIDPMISLGKPETWRFYLNDANKVIAASENAQGGVFSLSWVPNETIVTDAQLGMAARLLEETSGIERKGDIIVSGKKGIQFVRQVSGRDVFTVLAASKQYLITLVYSYGTNEMDKSKVESILAELVIGGDQEPFYEQRVYTHADPALSLTVAAPWAIMGLNNPGMPVSGQNTEIPEMNFHITLKPEDTASAGMNNEQYLASLLDQLPKDFAVGDIYHAALTQKSGDYPMGEHMPRGVHYRYRFEDAEGNARGFGAGYRVRDKGIVLALTVEYYGSDQEVFEERMEEFDRNVLNGLVFGEGAAKAAHPVEPPQNDEGNGEPVIVEPIVEDHAEAAPLAVMTVNSARGRALMGRILLQVERRGEAWYMSPRDGKGYYLGRAADAYQIMREQGLGITTEDVRKIPIGIVSLEGPDQDGDGLSDIFEDAIGTDPHARDTDADGVSDKQEIEDGTKPLVARGGLSTVDEEFASKHLGTIFLQVESRGEAWYVNPVDGKRYFLGRAEDAYNVMRFLGLGISEKDFANL